MSMTVLIYENRKQDPDMYDISTPEKEAAAYLKLFNYLREDWQVYSDIEEADEVTTLETCEPCGKEIHRLCEGNCACEATPACKQKSRYAQSDVARANSLKRLYNAALGGDAIAAKRLLQARKDHEYEGFSIGEVIDPLEAE